ncbi:hypothetical protein [Natrinema sp. 1APR25-10V2]|uniref:hypothetical protein n=1 Tax=Natrinema sp. 1APR25-10V2 TaxID=2951081 RepID=UPI002873F634|nr:hypothetical protein [Natrinema sp. 1APR25-10V2]MDS0473826.1 hypothetical protein [Natrinema sp. 1APR25-10V2]
MLEDIATLLVEGAFDWLVDRRRNRTGLEQFCLLFGLIGLLLAVAVAVATELWYGLALGIVGGALFVYGV